MKVLVIEDDSTLRKLLCMKFESMQLQPIPSAKEKETEALLKQHQDIAIAVVDMFLPAKAPILDSKESGLRLIRLMTELYPSIVSIVFTGQGDLYNAAKCMEAGAFSYCVKAEGPTADLIEKINKAKQKYIRNQIVHKGICELRDQIKDIQERLKNLVTSFDSLSEEIGS